MPSGVALPVRIAVALPESYQISSSSFHLITIFLAVPRTSGANMPEPIVIATWPFGTAATDAAMKRLAKGDAALDAALAGAEAVETDITARRCR